MLAGMRSNLSCFFVFVLALLALASLPVEAQINGVPASVTSIGFGGHFNPNPGVRASVTSLGPNGFGNSPAIFGNCCAGFFMPPNTNPPLFTRGRHRHHNDHGVLAVGILEPAYIPYPVPYAAAADNPEDDQEDDAPDSDYLRPSSHRRPAPAHKHAADSERTAYNSDLSADADARPSPVVKDRPVIAQPATILVFKNGNQSEVVNYAIVGDTLFDFSEGHTKKIQLADLDLPATHKANDNRGVEFQVPGSSKGQ